MTAAGTGGGTSLVSSAVPTLLVDDVGATVRWYVEQLGFQLTGSFPAKEPFAYASLQREGAELMLLRLAGYQKPDLTAQRPEGIWDAYLRTQGVRALYEGWKHQSFVCRPLQQMFYGNWEFEVRDPNGYIVVFGGSE